MLEGGIVKKLVLVMVILLFTLIIQAEWIREDTVLGSKLQNKDLQGDYFKVMKSDENVVGLKKSLELKFGPITADSLMFVFEHGEVEAVRFSEKKNSITPNMRLGLFIFGGDSSPKVKISRSAALYMENMEHVDEPGVKFYASCLRWSWIVTLEALEEIYETDPVIKKRLTRWDLEENGEIKLTVNYFQHGLDGKDLCNNVYSGFDQVIPHLVPYPVPGPSPDPEIIYKDRIIYIEIPPKEKKCPGARTFWSGYTSFSKTWMRKGIEDGSNESILFDAKWDDKQSDDEILNLKIARGYYENRWFLEAEGQLIDRVFNGNFHSGFETVFKKRLHWHFGACSQQRRFSFYLAGENQGNTTYYYQKKPWVSYYVGFFSQIDFWFGVRKSQFQKQLEAMNIFLPIRKKYQSFISLYAEVNSEPWKVWEEAQLTKWLVKFEGKIKPKPLYSYFNIEYKEFSREEIILEGSILDKPKEKSLYTHLRLGVSLRDNLSIFGLGQYINYDISKSNDITDSNFQIADGGIGVEWEIPGFEITGIVTYRETCERLDIGKPWGKELHNEGINFLIKVVKLEVRL